MYTRILIVLSLLFLVSISPSQGQSLCGDLSNCFTFDSGDTTFTYDFGSDGKLTIQFDTVLTRFFLQVKVSHPSDASCPSECGPTISLDPTEFPPGTLCVNYPGNSQGECDEYDISGGAGGPNGVPVKNKDYKGLITLTLSYDTDQTVNNPAFGHAPGDNPIFTENILTSYFQPTPIEPTMGGKVPGLSSLVALDEPLTQNDTSCFTFVPPVQENNSSQQKPVIEVAFNLLTSSGSGCTGAPIRDKTATLSVAMLDSSQNFVSFPPLMNGGEGNKFHWDSKNGINEYDISTESLQDGTYVVTVFSSKFSPQSMQFCLSGGAIVSC